MRAALAIRAQLRPSVWMRASSPNCVSLLQHVTARWHRMGHIAVLAACLVNIRLT
jgi:hypothetical protein